PDYFHVLFLAGNRREFLPRLGEHRRAGVRVLPQSEEILVLLSGTGSVAVFAVARCYRAGELTAVWVPNAAQEALRDLVRAREAAKRDQLKARHRLRKFLLRHDRQRPEGVKAWTKKHRERIKSHVRFEEAALEATLADYVEEVDHVAARIVKLEKAIDEAI